MCVYVYVCACVRACVCTCERACMYGVITNQSHSLLTVHLHPLTPPPRYAILTPEMYPHWHGTDTEGIKHLMATVNMEPDQWQLGKSKVFIKSPESVRCVQFVLGKDVCLYEHIHLFVLIEDPSSSWSS